MPDKIQKFVHHTPPKVFNEKGSNFQNIFIEVYCDASFIVFEANTVICDLLTTSEKRVIGQNGRF